MDYSLFSADAALFEDAHRTLRLLETHSIDLVYTSPPFALLLQSDHHYSSKQCFEWFWPVQAELTRVLKPDGSLVLDVPVFWQKDRRIRHPFPYELLVHLCRSEKDGGAGWHLAQELYWCKPINEVMRGRLVESVSPIWWLSRTPYPRADNRRALLPYSGAQRKLIENGDAPGVRPSGHRLSGKFGKNNGGSIAPNIIEELGTHIGAPTLARVVGPEASPSLLRQCPLDFCRLSSPSLRKRMDSCLILLLLMALSSPSPLKWDGDGLTRLECIFFQTGSCTSVASQITRYGQGGIMPKRTKRSPPGRIVIGFDPGLAIVGYAVVREAKEKLVLLACDIIRTPSHTLLEDRLLSIYEQAAQIIQAHRPDEAAVEALFFGKNRTTALDVSHARGVLLLAVRKQGIPLAHYSPSVVKQKVTGSGRANKLLVGKCVQQQLRLKAVPRPDDAADAAAVALCHIALTNLLPPH